MNWKILIAMLMLAIAGSANADQSGKLACVSWDADYDGSGKKPCLVVELQVEITSEEDQGLPGAFWITVQTEDGEVMAYTTANGLVEYPSAMLAMAKPADGFFKALPAKRKYTIYKGTKAGLCTISKGRNYKVYAGRGAFTGVGEDEITTLVAANRPASEIEHRKEYYIIFDTAANPQKSGIVHHHLCHTEN